MYDVREWRLETLRADVRGLEDLPLPREVRPIVVGEPLGGLRSIFSGLTNTPCLSLHLKYLTPFTVPLCLPVHVCMCVCVCKAWIYNANRKFSLG